jgi:hypothetical protein
MKLLLGFGFGITFGAISFAGILFSLSPTMFGALVNHWTTLFGAIVSLLGVILVFVYAYLGHLWNIIEAATDGAETLIGFIISCAVLIVVYHKEIGAGIRAIIG